MEFSLKIFARLAVILTAMPIHEYAHAYIATKLGDDTPRLSGRLTLNPMYHLDIMGSIMILFFGIGFARPVPVNPYNFRGNRRRGMALTALAGPASNVIMAFILMIIQKMLFYNANVFNIFGNASAIITIIQLLEYMIFINISLGVFNLIPLYPLDGSRILGYFIPAHIERKIEENSQIISLILLGVIFLGFLDKPIGFLTYHVYNGLEFLTSFVDIFFKTFM